MSELILRNYYINFTGGGKGYLCSLNRNGGFMLTIHEQEGGGEQEGGENRRVGGGFSIFKVVNYNR